MLFQIKGRFSGFVQAEVEITCAHNASERTKLGKAVLAAISQGANLRGADLGGANLGGANLYGANLYGANLRGADLGGANLGRANLRGANLRGADLYGADLGGADLYGANLGGANLGGANLGGADLRSADLYGANLGGANLGGANLGGAVSKVTRLVSAIRRSDGYMFFGFVKDDSTLGIVAGCQNRTLADYRKRVAKVYLAEGRSHELRAETTDILDFLEKRHAAMVSK